ncbi:glycosyltransferase family 2 protein [Pseudoscourfieldia marina]
MNSTEQKASSMSDAHTRILVDSPLSGGLHGETAKRKYDTPLSSSLPRSPFPLASTYAERHRKALSNKLSKNAHTTMYTIYCLFFTAGMPTCVYWGLVKPGYVSLPIVHFAGLMWAAMIVWYYLEMSVVLVKHFISADKKLGASDEGSVPFSVIVVAYLPNEADIIIETLEHLRSNFEEDNLEVVLAYNTPEPMEVEYDLRELQSTWKNFRSIKVPGSTSKCDNINHVLPMLSHEYVALFDSDHLPEPDAFKRAAHHLRKRGYDIVQGRTVINSKFCSGLLGNLIRTEFELRHGIEHEVRNTVYNYAIFGGSNGYWRTRVLQDVGMDPEMLTEDVDSAIRALSHGYKVWYDHHLVALEQPPPSFHALLKQRLRWSQGWFQVARRSILPMYTSERFALWTKVGMWWMLKMLIGVQMLYSLVLCFILVNVSTTYGLSTTLKVSVANAIPTWIMLFGFIELPFTNKLLYAVITPFTAFAFQLIDLMAQVRLLVGYSQWNVTPRFTKQQMNFSVAASGVGAVSGAPAPSGHGYQAVADSHNTVPTGTVPSPTFRYSPSFVRVADARSHMGASAV